MFTLKKILFASWMLFLSTSVFATVSCSASGTGSCTTSQQCMNGKTKMLISIYPSGRDGSYKVWDTGTGKTVASGRYGTTHLVQKTVSGLYGCYKLKVDNDNFDLNGDSTLGSMGPL